jgi:hypothetical protein
MHHRKFWFGKLLFAFFAIAALGWLVMALWNWILPSLFTGFQAIDYWRALGLLVLCRILFGGFHGHGGWHRYHHMQRWHQMTDEERKRFKEGLMGISSWHHHADHHPSYHRPAGQTEAPKKQD